MGGGYMEWMGVVIGAAQKLHTHVYTHLHVHSHTYTYHVHTITTFAHTRDTHI